jgi:hypothetical protein
MSFDDFMIDKVTLIKQSGERMPDIPASVQRNKIFVNDASLVIEPGDLFERVTSNGLRETYEIIDPGFHEGFHGIDARYQITVRRSANAPARSTAEKRRTATSSGLYPWGVISALVFDLDSDDVVEIMSLAGLQVDWSVTSKESFSHSTRKRAYRTRVDAAFFKVDDSDKLRVSWVASSELVRRHPNTEGALRERLSAIGWTFDKDTLHPAS